ncbi:NUDIX domain-containing protein [Candidatus Woesearchaeota archaeon]|nr:NUDIX domain-containing protein [Candidatus Woesearchaeota archaeon]
MTQQIQGIAYRKIGDKHQFLLLKRIPEKGGFWQPISGKVEHNEGLQEALFRELMEEANIHKMDILRLVPDVHKYKISRHYLTDEPIEPITETVFGVEIKPETKISIHGNTSKEHSRFIWAEFEDAVKMLKWEDNIKAIHLLLKKIKN